MDYIIICYSSTINLSHQQTVIDCALHYNKNIIYLMTNIYYTQTEELKTIIEEEKWFPCYNESYFEPIIEYIIFNQYYNQC